MMRKLTSLLVVLALLAGAGGCGVTRPVETITKVVYEYRDSVRLRDSTILVPIPVERIVDVVPVYDTLKLETGVAAAAAYVDTLTHTLKGKLVNKPDSLRTIIRYQDRLVTITRDSISIKEVPVEVEVPVRYVPKVYRWSLVWSVISILALILLVYLKLK